MKELLRGYRAIDLTDGKGFWCGKTLGDLGVDVIKVERPGGDRERSIGPFYQGDPEPNKSLYWFAFNGNKRGITLDVETSRGQEIFRKLAKTADFVIESFSPRYLDGLGLGYKDISRLKPSLIMTSITPFGQDGPYGSFNGSELLAEAMGGLMYITGEQKKRPLSAGFDYAYQFAGLQAATGTLIAHYASKRNGRGQHVDVSIQQAVLVTLYPPQQLWFDSKVIQGRYGQHVIRGQKLLAGLSWECKDGHILWRMMTGNMGRRLRALVEWMDEEGKADGLLGVDWESVDMNAVSQKQINAWEQIFAKFFLTKTKQELYYRGSREGMMVFPVNNTEDLLKDMQLESRGFWIEVEHPELEASLIYPGVPFRITGFCYSLTRGPLIGEHNQEVYCNELGFSEAQLRSLMEEKII